MKFIEKTISLTNENFVSAIISNFVAIIVLGLGRFDYLINNGIIIPMQFIRVIIKITLID